LDLPDTQNKRRRLENPPSHEELGPDGIIGDDDSPQNFQGNPSLGEGSVRSMGGEEGITRVNSDVEDVVQGGHRHPDDYDVRTNSTICTPNVLFVSITTNRKMRTVLILEA
jgi:hypothetical protein